MRWKERGEGEGWLEKRAKHGELTPEQAIAAIQHAPDFVYFVQAVDGGLIKIGVTKDMRARLAALQIGAPVQLRILGVIRGGYTEEKELHRRFSQHRRHGEWFEPCPLLMTLIDSIAEPWEGA